MSESSRRLLLAALGLCVVAALLAPYLPAPPAAAQGGLFVPTARQPDLATLGRDPAVVRARYVAVNLAALGGLKPAPGARAPAVADALTLDLFPTAAYPLAPVVLGVVREHTAPTSSGRGLIWYGRVAGQPASQVTLVAEDGVLVGNIRIGTTAAYQVRYAGNGVHVIYEVDPRRYPNERPPIPVIGLVPRPLLPGLVPADDGSQIDVMVVYTAAARAEAGGTTAINNQVDLGIAETNTSYANSGVTQRVRLVYKGEVTYTETGNIDTDLARLQNPSDGYLDEVHTLRNTYGADIVSLWVADGGGFCGIGYLMTTVSSAFASYTFNVVTRSCATGNYSFGHEMGHNMGAHHDRYVSSENGAYPYSHGYVASNGAWRTIMAYANACGGTCPRVQYWSNPDVTYTDGQAMGVPEGSPQAADNRKTLNNTAYTVANFRQASPPPPLANDNFSAATVVSVLPAHYTLDTSGATTESGEPLTCGSASMGKTVWYRFTPAAPTTVAVSTAGSGFDTMVAVYTGGALGALTQVACNDDFGGTLQSRVTFAAAAGTTYQVQVGGYGGASGSLVVDITGTTATSTPTATPTRTPTPTPTPTPVCGPRPRVTVTTTPASGGRLQVVITTPTSANDYIQALVFGQADNGLVDIPGGPTGQAGNFTYTPPPGTGSVTFFVRRATPGQATTVHLTVRDGCGTWPTFVGGGPSAF
jgi:hypothetical protein